MNRRLTVPLAVLTVAALGVVPSQAAPKKKPAPITGSYTITMAPDPTPDVGSLGGQFQGCNPFVSQTTDKHPFTAPAAGVLTVVLDSQDPTKGGAPAGPDWDLYLKDSTGEVGSSHGPTAHEEAVAKLKKKTDLTFVACNLNGAPTATVTYTFTFK